MAPHLRTFWQILEAAASAVCEEMSNLLKTPFLPIKHRLIQMVPPKAYFRTLAMSHAWAKNLVMIAAATAEKNANADADADEMSLG